MVGKRDLVLRKETMTQTYENGKMKILVLCYVDIYLSKRMKIFSLINFFLHNGKFI